jgi:hypothetical protein
MTVFRHILWGYELSYPDHWTHRSVEDADAFFEALDAGGEGLESAQVLVRGEWNWERKPIEPMWNRHIGLLAGMVGAKQVGSAPWKLGGASGLEAEIVLSKKENQRLWTGILMQDFRVLHFMVTHPREARQVFEPAATKVISSLRFPNRILGIKANREGVPLPPGYEAVDPTRILADITEPEKWRAYSGLAGIGALQAFYIRELPIHNWDMEEYVPFPSSSELGFARLQLRKGNLKITLGIMPYDPSASGTITPSSPANIAIKVSSV